MNRKKPVLTNTFLHAFEEETEFRKILELGLLLALKEKGYMVQVPYDRIEELNP